MATGNHFATFLPHGSIPPSSNMATLDTRNLRPVLCFDASTEESVYFDGVLPDNYAGGGLTIDLYWMGASATSGNVVWGSSIEALNGLDQDGDSFATEQTATGAANGTSGIYTKTSVAHSSGANMDSLAAGAPYRLKIARKAADGSDTMAGDAHLTRVVVRET